ncbi:putative porin [uncultured Selenomonas sp.]|uniref:putative porin n=1 Tax=uncultured Selenomonas sp. TaxID=159275 RepID=UPI0025F7024E|nr:putative porin [uncultured Selenomonas sp.]
MKKTLVSALTTALVVGAASTTFAAANPFSDVPADHWAYDAVTQLAADGVIEGYGDTTFQGDKSITRYEMAQMVAKAMAKTDVSAADKAMIDKLAAEFADELNNLGVRVSNLEKHADMVKWNGKVEYTYTSVRHKYDGKEYSRANDDHLLFRLEPTAEVNDHWDVHARLDAATDMDTDEGHNSNVELKRAWAQGNYKNFTVKLGKFASEVNNTIVFDDPFSGFGVTFGNALKATAEAGRVSSDTLDLPRMGKTSSYQGLGLAYDFGKLSTKAGFQHFDWNVDGGIYVNSDSDDVNIWSVGANYAFDKNVAFNAEYAKGNADRVYREDAQDKAYVFELNYKGAEAANKGTWGAWLGYRYLGNCVALDATYDAITGGYKGWEVGANYTPFKNIVTTLRYGDNKALIDNDFKMKKLFGRVEFFF